MSDDASCTCRCHDGGPQSTCNVDRGYGVGCGPHSDDQPCDVCGLIGAHQPVEGDCVLPHRYDRKKHPPIAAHGFTCKGCVERHRDWLTEISDLYVTLHEVIAVGSVSDDVHEYQKPRKQPASPAPLRLEAWAMSHDRARMFAAGREYLTGLPDIPAVLSSWCDYAVESGAHDMNTDTIGIVGAVAQLKDAAEHMGGVPLLDDYDAELRWIRRCLRAAHGINEPSPIGSCLTVSCRGLVWPVGGERPRCNRCNRRYDIHDIVRLHAQQKAEAS